MCRQPDESLTGQCKHNITQGFLLVSLLWYQKVVFGKCLTLSSSLYSGISFIAIHQQCILFWTGIGHTLIEVRREIKLVHEIDLVCDHLQHTKRLSIKNWELPELLFLYIHLNQCEELLSKLLEVNLKIYLE